MDALQLVLLLPLAGQGKSCWQHPRQRSSHLLFPAEFNLFHSCNVVSLQECRDLLAKPSERASLPIVESVDEGFGIAGLTSRSARK